MQMEHPTAVASQLKRSNGKTGAASFLLIRGSVLGNAVNDVTGTSSHCSTSNSAARQPTSRCPASLQTEDYSSTQTLKVKCTKLFGVVGSLACMQGFWSSYTCI